MRLQRRAGGDEDFQMAPMIDMVFLLLVFFMTVSTLAQDERIPLPLPESDRSQVPEKTEGRGTLSLQTSADGQLAWYLGSTRISPEELSEKFSERLKEDPDFEITLRAPAGMPYREIREALKLCAEAGAFNIIYAAYQAP